MNKVCRDAIALSFVPEMGNKKIISFMQNFGDLEEGSNSIRSIQRSEEYLKEMDYIEKNGIKTVCYKDAHYPDQLRNIYDPPAILYYKGELEAADIDAVAIVGTRRCSIYGLQMAEKLAYDLAEKGITVVSGMARGIDTAAHNGALKAKGRTIAVMGSGFGRVYPEGSESLIEKIAENGAVLTEYPSFMQPLQYNFPNRNRIISGLAKGVVVVEAAKKSGALITADFALEQGKDVFAVPGRADSYVSKGSNKLIQDGAKLVMDVNDILEELKMESPAKDNVERPILQKKDAAQPEEERILNSIRTEKVVHVNDMLEKADMGIGELSEILVRLEMKGFVKALAGKRYCLSEK